MDAILFLVTRQYQQVYVNISKRMPSFPFSDSETTKHTLLLQQHEYNPHIVNCPPQLEQFVIQGFRELQPGRHLVLRCFKHASLSSLSQIAPTPHITFKAKQRNHANCFINQTAYFCGQMVPTKSHYICFLRLHVCPFVLPSLLAHSGVGYYSFVERVFYVQITTANILHPS